MIKLPGYNNYNNFSILKARAFLNFQRNQSRFSLHAVGMDSVDPVYNNFEHQLGMRKS